MFKKIRAAQVRLKGYATKTPIMTSRTLDRLVGAEVYCKCENFQKIGAFKFRGGLLSGSAISAKSLSPNCRVIGIEPELADDATRSFQTKELHHVQNPPTIADGTRTSSLGSITFPLVLEYVDDMKTVSEEAICDAVKFLFYRMKIVVEPSGALGLAALLSGAVPSEGRVGVILSGGNIDSTTMTRILRNS